MDVHEQRVRRRDEARRRRTRRRRALLITLVVALAAVIGAVWLSVGGRVRTASTVHGHPPGPLHSLVSRRDAGRSAARRVRLPASRAAVPILMYHVIAPPVAGAPYPGLYVPAPEFAAQMRALHAAGYRAVTMDEMRAAWRGRAQLPARPIVISFDNGYRTQYTAALPILRRFGWVGVENLQLSGLPPSQGGLSPSEVRALISAGWELDTQGYSHADLIQLDPAELHFQVADARRILQRRYHVATHWFCYPSGHYNATVIAAVRAAGFVGSTTVVPGWAQRVDDPYRLPRLRVLGGTSPSQLLALVADSRTAAAPPTDYPAGG